MLTICKDCAENFAYAPASAVFDAKQATVTWASQKISYVFGESSHFTDIFVVQTSATVMSGVLQTSTVC